VIIAPSAVLLDLDGTLVDPAGAITSGIRHALKQADVPDPGEEKLRTLIGRRWSWALRRSTASNRT